MNAVSVPVPLHQASSKLAMREPIARARHLPGHFYCAPETLALEKQRIFTTHWLCVGRQEELANVGDYMALRIADQPILVVRNTEGEIVVLRNRCVHRGVEVAYDSGNAKGFVCPYHAWSFDLSGRLTAAGFMRQSEADLSNAALPRVRSALWRGWIFVNFDDQSPSFAEYVAPYEQSLWFYQSDKARLADKMEVEVHTNWKFVVENLLDMYHVSTLHAKTFGKFLRLIKDELPFDALPDGGLAFTFESKPMTADGSQGFPVLNWLQQQDLGFAAKANMFPNMNLSMRADGMRMWVMWPVSPERTKIVSYLLVDPSAFDRPEFQERLAAYRVYLRSIVQEDQQAVESLQRNARAPDFEPGPLSHLEGPIHHVLNHYLDVIGA